MGTAPILDAMRGISLDELDERAQLLRRVDRKYLIAHRELRELLERLGEDHDVLDIDGRRRFAYRSVYFDTPDLRAFHDHVADRAPRFKLRTRCYLDAGSCQFEVKLRRADGETDKRQAEHPPDAPERLGDDAWRLVREAMRDNGTEPPRELVPVLATAFERFTLADRDGDSRVTGDLRLRLCRLPDGGEVRLRDGEAILETKSRDGSSTVDRLLAERGIEPASLSKYRAGIDLLVERDPGARAAALRRHFA